MGIKGTASAGVWLFLLALLVGVTTAAADEGAGTAAEANAVAAQLEGIRGELKSIVQLLGSVEEHQQLSVLMTRIRLKQERMMAIEGELRSARGEHEAAEREAKRIEGIERSWTQGLDDALEPKELDENERRQLDLMREEKKSLESRAEVLRLRIVELENDVARAQDDIRALEETVDERLGLR